MELWGGLFGAADRCPLHFSRLRSHSHPGYNARFGEEMCPHCPILNSRQEERWLYVPAFPWRQREGRSPVPRAEGRTFAWCAGKARWREEATQWRWLLRAGPSSTEAVGYSCTWARTSLPKSASWINLRAFLLNQFHSTTIFYGQGDNTSVRVHL